jgi:Ca2+-binding EF-hand superfamily protein
LGRFGEQVNDEVVNQMINIADKDGDGRISFEEFCKLFISNYTPEPNQGRSFSPPN